MEEREEYRSRLFMRLYAEVETTEQAASLAPLLVLKMEGCAPIQVRSIFPYWKIPVYYGFEFDFHPVGDHTAAFDCVVALSPKGWTFMSSPQDRSAVWNPIPGAVFLAEQVRWANLLFFYKQT